MELLVLFKTVVLTISADIDKEYVHYRETIESSQRNVYFADYYFSWQRGLHENINGLLR
jgi:IS30 family transposase